MIGRTMPRHRPPFLQRRVSRHGVTAWYVRIGKGPLIRVRATFGTPEFDVEYQAAVSGNATNTKRQQGRPQAGTLAWLIERYRETAAWAGLKPATRRNRDNHFRRVIANAGQQPYRAITQTAIENGKERRSATPAQARNYLDAVRGLFRWAKDAKLVATDPTEGVHNPRRKKGKGFLKWTEADVEKYYARWPLGTRQRVWVDVLMYTGGRRGDAVTIGRQHVSKKGICAFFTEKSGELVPVTIPILPVLQRTLDAGPTGDLAFICGKNGKPLSKESFGNEFKKACKVAGILDKSAHGCRKIAATRAADNGATVHELMAIFGWTGMATAAVYTQEADRALAGQRAGGKLAVEVQKNENGKSMLPPCQEVVTSERKAKR